MSKVNESEIIAALTELSSRKALLPALCYLSNRSDYVQQQEMANAIGCHPPVCCRCTRLTCTKSFFRN